MRDLPAGPELQHAQLPGAFCAVCQQIVVEALGHHLFANVPPPAERPIERATHLLTFTAPGTSQSHLLLYDNATGRIVVYACDPFAVPGATPVGRQDTIAPWWNSLTAVNYRGAPHVLAIQRGTGRTALYKIATSSNGYTLAHVWGGTPVAPPPVPFEVPGGFVRLLAVPFTHQNGLHWLEYDAASSGAVIKRINEPLQTLAVVRAEPFSGGRVGFIPFQLPTKPEVHFFSCEILTGTVSLHKFTGDTVAQVWTGVNFLPAGQTALVPLYAWDGSPFLLAHSAFSMWQRLYRVNAEGKGLEFVWRTTTDLVPFAFLPFVFSGQVRAFLPAIPVAAVAAGTGVDRGLPPRLNTRAGGDTPTWSQVTFRTLATRSVNSVVPMYKPSTQKNHQHILVKHLPAFGEWPVARVHRQEIQAYVARITTGGYAPKTIEHIHDVLSTRHALEHVHLVVGCVRSLNGRVDR